MVLEGELEAVAGRLVGQSLYAAYDLGALGGEASAEPVVPAQMRRRVQPNARAAPISATPSSGVARQ